MKDLFPERTGRFASLTWYGQAGFRLAAGESRVLIDPFFTDRPDRRYRPPASPADFADITLVLCTHEHGDHLDLPFLREFCAVNAAATIVVPGRPSSRSRPPAAWTGPGWPARRPARNCATGT